MGPRENSKGHTHALQVQFVTRPPPLKLPFCGEIEVKGTVHNREYL